MLLTNPSFNELFELPPLFDWARYGMSLLTDEQWIDPGLLPKVLDSVDDDGYALAPQAVA